MFLQHCPEHYSWTKVCIKASGLRTGYRVDIRLTIVCTQYRWLTIAFLVVTEAHLLKQYVKPFTLRVDFTQLDT
jgi:hypothetical protein